MSTFEPATVQALCAFAIAPSERKQRVAFLKEWDDNVQARWDTWKNNRKNQSIYLPQLEWEAHVCEYVSFVAKQVRQQKPAPPGLHKALDKKIPLLGPRFTPPTFLHIQKRSMTPDITPDQTYLKPLNVVHPFYYPEIAKCPRCGSEDVYWNGWSGTGHREVHGVAREETAIGAQLRCKTCEAKAKLAAGQRKSAGKDEGYSILTTNHLFWEGREHWEITPGIPHFFKRCAVTSELFDLIIELRPSSTAAGLAENIKQLHLLEYHRNRLAYLQCYRARTEKTAQMSLLVSHTAPGLRNFSAPMKSGKHLDGFDITSITDDLITDLYNKFCQSTRQKESEDSLRVKGAVAISLDATFRTAAKATIVDSSNGRTKSYKGGIESVINEKNLIIAWRFCHTQGNSEVEELLTGLKRRFDLLGIAYPVMATVDNCCHVKAAILKVFPDISVCLDVWHFMMRYMICIIGGMKNPARQAVARDIVDAILKSPANGRTPAIYWGQADQERRLVEAFDKWAVKGNVWSAAAAKTHAEQLSHVKKGCLARPRNDVRSDGSRIESSHKGWNGLQRSHASGLESLTALCHDFVLRRNLRVELATGVEACAFTLSTHGSHHIRLVNEVARLWNDIINKMQRSERALPADIKPLPTLEPANSGESFGLTVMGLTTAAHHALITLKEEPSEDDGLLDLSSQDLLNARQILSDIGVDPDLAYQLPQHTQPAAIAPTVPIPGARSHGSGTHPTSPAFDTGHTPSDVSTICARSPPGTSVHGLTNTLRHLSVEPIDVDALEGREMKCEVIQTALSTSASSEKGQSLKRRATDDSDVISIPDDDPPDNSDLQGPTAASSTAGSAAPNDLDPSLRIGDSSHPSPKKKLRITVSGMPKMTPERQMFAMAHTRLNSAVSDAVPAQVAAHQYDSAQHLQGLRPVAGTGSSSSSQVGPRAGRIEQFFAAPKAASPSVRPTVVRPSLPCPTISGMTRSQRLFSIATGVDPRTLSFARGGDRDEYFLYMRLRKEQQWASYRMTPFDWVCASSLYNTELQKLNRERGKTLSLKSPRALMEKLGEVEQDILGRIATGNYASRSSKDSPFWREHCHAVPLGKNQGGSEVNGQPKKSRKNHMCARCKTIKYPGPEGSDLNHKKLYCSDGVRQASQKVRKLIAGQPVDVLEEPPPFPQPKDVFTNGTHFHPARFISAVQEMYERVITNRNPGGASAMQDLAFASLLRERVEVIPATDREPSMVLFKLYSSLKLGNCPPEIIVERSGEQFLRIDYLSDPPAVEASSSGSDA